MITDVALTRVAKRRLIIALIAGAVLVALVVGVQRVLVFPGRFREAPAEPAPDPSRQTLRLSIGGGTVEAWLLLGHGVDAEHPGPLVIYAHGNGALIDHWPRQLEHYRERGISVLLPEYRGYGRSAGSPSQRDVVADYVAFYDLAVSRPEVDAAAVVAHGRSLGGGVVTALATQRPLLAMVLHSTFTSIGDLAWEHYFTPPAIIIDSFDNVGALPKFEAPVLILHGRDDTLVPVAHAQALMDAAPNGRVVLFDGGHNDSPWPLIWPEVDALLAEAGLPATIP